MNKLTRDIKDKGYSLTEFCREANISLRTYRTYEKEDHKLHNALLVLIYKLKDKDNGR